MEALSFVIVGHVDHGKSTLIGRLLYDTNSLAPDKIDEIKRTSKDLGRQTEFAYLLDHLEEERQQGVTIDTTQVFFKTDKRQYVIIDAPGHVEFVKNMATGASQAEAAVLIVDVKEGVQEQTRRHAYILSLLGLDQVVVVLNKMDLVGYSEQTYSQVKDDVTKFLASIHIQPDYYVPICALEGDNIAKKSDKMDWYTGPCFLETLDTLRNKENAEDKPLLFPIQDAYKVDDKRIFVGRIESGVIKVADEIKVLPSGQTTKVRSIEKFMEEPMQACAGRSIGITTEAPLFLNRGDVICSPGKEPVLSNRFHATVFWLSKSDFNKGEKLSIRCATQETNCKVEQIKKRIDSSTLQVKEEDAGLLKNLEVGEAIFKSKKPLAIKEFNDVAELGRFVLVRDQNICAGGIITDTS
jgi:sulfate adenylyltransferase large subunit